MNNLSTRFWLVAFLVSLLLPLFGQEAEKSSRLTVLESLAKSSDLEQKEMALEGLSEIISGGAQGRETDQALELLILLANEGITNITYEGHKKGAAFPVIRAEAAILLGETGDSRALEPLLNILFYDDDTEAVQSAVTAAAKIGTDEKGKLVLALSQILRGTRQAYHSEKLVQITLEAVGVLEEQYPALYENEDIIAGIEYCSQSYSGYGRTTRKMASELLSNAPQ